MTSELSIKSRLDLQEKTPNWKRRLDKSYIPFGIACVTFLVMSAALEPVNAGEIEDYVHSLEYDPRTLLSLPEDGSTEAVPAKSEVKDRKSIVICTSKKMGADNEFKEITLFNSSSGVIYPGALIRANKNLAKGSPELVSLPRGQITVSLDLPGITDEAPPIENASNSKVQLFINDQLEKWNEVPSSKGYINAARSVFNVKKAYSEDQLAIDLGFSAEWMDNSLSAQLSIENQTSKTTTVAFYRQAYYTATYDPPESMSNVFGSSANLDDIRREFDNENPPAYIASVDYGRIILVKMETSRAAKKQAVEAAFKYATAGGANLNAKGSVKHSSVLENSTFTTFTLGGNSIIASEVIQADSANAFKKLYDIIHQGAGYNRENPGRPIAYTVKFLKKNKLALINSTTDYTKAECTEYAQGYLKFKHSAGYEAAVWVSWRERDEDGVPLGNRVDWKRGWPGEESALTAGVVETKNLPADANDIEIRVVAHTALPGGLSGMPYGWHEVMNTTVKGPTNKCYVIKGGTANRSHEVVDGKLC